MTRAAIALAANEAVDGSRYWHPVLVESSPIGTLLDWLACCDPNGEWSLYCQQGPELATHGEDELTLADCWDAIAGIVGAS